MAPRDVLNEAIALLKRAETKGLVQTCYGLGVSRDRSVEIMMSRAQEMRTPLAALFAGIYQSPDGLEELNRAIDSATRNSDVTSRTSDEVVIGSGIHGVTYCANRKRPPVVLEANQTAGGVFDWSRMPAFLLNSRNVDGDVLGLPGKGQMLNGIEGGIVQPSDFNGDEYQDNTPLALAIRLNALFFGKVFTGTRVTSINPYTDLYYRIRVNDDADVFAKRIIIATGLGSDNYKVSQNWVKYGPDVMTFRQFMKYIAVSQFPLRGLKRVAVIGAGDCGKVAVQFLLGQGPSTFGSSASLDRVERIDWYGQSSINGEDFELCNRNRYASIAKAMSSQKDFRYARVFAKPGRVTEVLRNKAPDGVIVKWKSLGKRSFVNGGYDLVITCTGFHDVKSELLNLNKKDFTSTVFDNEGKCALATKIPGEEIYAVGPASGLPYSELDVVGAPVDLKPQSDNLIAIWRHGKKVAALARQLP